MSTRGAIARPADSHEGAFSGRYHHWDSYPEGLGATLWHLRREHFNGDTDAMLRYLIDEHPAGWSTINGKDLTLAPGFRESRTGGLPCVICGESDNAHLCQTFGPNAHPYGKYPCGVNYAYHLGHEYQADPAALAAVDAIPECYCHGSRSEDAWEVTDADAAESGVEWVYVLDGPLMHVLSSRNENGEKMIGMFGMGNPDAKWVGVARINMADPTPPDWAAISARG